MQKGEAITNKALVIRKAEGDKMHHATQQHPTSNQHGDNPQEKQLMQKHWLSPVHEGEYQGSMQGVLSDGATENVKEVSTKAVRPQALGGEQVKKAEDIAKAAIAKAREVEKTGKTKTWLKQ